MTTPADLCPTSCAPGAVRCCETSPASDTLRCADCGREWTITVDEPARRVLVTGSRAWRDPATIRAALAEVWGRGEAVLVSGSLPGRG